MELVVKSQTWSLDWIFNSKSDEDKCLSQTNLLEYTIPAMWEWRHNWGLNYAKSLYQGRIQKEKERLDTLPKSPGLWLKWGSYWNLSDIEESIKQNILSLLPHVWINFFIYTSLRSFWKYVSFSYQSFFLNKLMIREMYLKIHVC